MNNHTLQNTKGEPIRAWNHRSRNRRTHKVPYIAGCCHGKTQGFVLRLPPQNKPHATFAQPLQCVLQQQVHIHAANTWWFASTRCRTTRENQSHAKTYGPQPPHRQGTLHRRLQPPYTEKHKVSFSGFLPNPSPMQQPCSHYNAFCSSRYIFDYIAICTHALQNTKGEPITRQNEQSATAAQTRYPSSLPAATLHGTTRFRSPASFPTQVPCNRHAAITKRFAAADTYSCSHYIAICIHALQDTKGEPIMRQNEQSATAAQTRYPSSLPAATLHGKHKVSFSGFLPKTNPMQQACSHYNAFCSSRYIFMQPLHCDLHPRVAEHQGRTNHTSKRTVWNRRTDEQPLCMEKHKVSFSGFPPKTSPMQHSCSHYNAFCSNTYAFMQPCHCDLHPRVAEHQGRTNHTSKRTVRNRRTDEVPASSPPAATLHGKPRKVSCSGFLPNTSPMQHSCNHYNAFCNITWQTRISLRTWQQNMTKIRTTLNECMVMWCKVSHRPSWTYCYVM